MTTRVAVATGSSYLSLVIRRTLGALPRVEVLAEDRDAERAASTLESNPDLAIVDADLLTGEDQPLIRLLYRRSRPSILLDPRARGVAAGLAGRPGTFVLSGRHAGQLDLDPIESGLRPLLDRARRHGRRHGQVDTGVAPPQAGPAGRPRCSLDLVVVGVSTGGPPLLQRIVRDLAPPRVPMLIVQHMPESHTAGFAARLDEAGERHVVEVAAGALPPVGTIAVVRGGRDYRVLRRADGGLALREVRLPENSFHPSIDAILASALDGGLTVATAILTGMGRDGAAGAAALSRRGLPVVVQRPDTCAVAGMPQSVLDLGAAQRVCDPADLVATLDAWCSGKTAVVPGGDC